MNRFHHSFIGLWSGWLVVLGLVLSGGMVWSQGVLKTTLLGEEKSAEAAVPAISADAEVSNIVKQVSAEISALALDSVSVPPEEIAYRNAKLDEIKKHAEERLQILGQISEPPSEQPIPLLVELPNNGEKHSVLMMDQLRILLRARKTSQVKYHEVVETAVQESDYARKQLLIKQQELRALKELAELNAEQNLQVLRLPYEVRLLEQLSEVQQLRLKVVRRDEERTNAELLEIEKHTASIQEKIYFPLSDYQEVQVQLDQREANLKRKVEDHNFKLRMAEARPLSAETSEQIRVIRRLSEALEEQLQRIPDDRLAWQRRYDLYNAPPGLGQRLEWDAEARKQVSRIERLIRVKEIQLEELKQALLSKSADESSGAVKEQPEATISVGIAEVLTALERSQDLQENLLSDCATLSRISPVSGVWPLIEDGARKAWYFEIASIDDRPITVRKVVLALLLFIAGIKLVRWLSLHLMRRIMSRTKVGESSSIAISTLLFYALSLLIFVISLGFAGIPLTLFTLLGGALAIGLGFGSQNIINNFISGLILLMERPIRVNDMVEVNGTNGKVVRVGLRCTQVRTFDNVDIMVPNSSFLESNVINWTLTDDRARGELFIGVAYGTPTDRVKALMLQSAEEHVKILKEPAPEVMFMDFGDNALIFRMYIWVHMRSPSDRDRVLSDLRYRVDELFRNENLIIAYPQRDIHLDTLKPLEIKWVGPSTPGAV